MIRTLGSDLKSFKTLTFGPGLNVILADKSRGASDRQSRNGAGKTSFVELVHFLFGADAKPTGIFRSEALRDCTFTATVDLRGKLCSISRGGQKPSRIHIAGDVEDCRVAQKDEPPLFAETKGRPRILASGCFRTSSGRALLATSGLDCTSTTAPNGFSRRFDRSSRL